MATLEDAAPFDLLLTDVVMPGGMNGVLLAREAQHRYPQLRVLLMTGYADGTLERWGGEHYELLISRSPPMTSCHACSACSNLPRADAPRGRP